MSVRVRYAPSPTGLQHIGGIRTALFNYFFAKANGGKFLLRIEDTDRERYTEESLEDLFSTLNWLGVKWDEGPLVGGPFGPYVQSERIDLYQEYAKKLVEDGKAYYCFCTSERLEEVRKEQEAKKSDYRGYDRHCSNLSKEEVEGNFKKGLKAVIRLKVPTEGKTTFHDVLMGNITRRNRDVSPDPVLLKSDGYPTYHLANVIDDHLMEITHIMRAQEWIPSGPLHILLYEAFGWTPPTYCHLPMVMGKDGQKLSKRHGDTAVRDFIAKGYLPEAIINYVSLVGWSLDGQTEFFTKETLEKVFKLEGIHKAPGVFDYKKLDWFNGQYIREKSNEEVIALITPYLKEAGYEFDNALLEKLAPSVKERMKVLSDVVPLSAFLFSDKMADDEALYISKGMDKEKTLDALKKGSSIIINGLNSDKDFHLIEEEIMALATEMGIKVNGVFQPIRVAITSSTVSLPLKDSISLLGKEETIKRLNRAIDFLAKGDK